VTATNPRATAANPTTFVIGAGPVATALAGALRLGGVPVLGLWARRPAQARAAGATAGVAAFSSAPPDLLLETRVEIHAVRDQVVGEIAAMLAGTGLIGKRHVMLHCGGAASARERLGAVAEQVGGVGTLHPLSAISDGKLAMRALRGTVFGVEGDEAGRAAASALVAALGGVVLPLEGSQMAAYHAAAALASNYVVAAVDVAAAVLATAGVDPDKAARALVPLAEGALRNITAQGTTSGLTGAVRRGDVETVRRHLQTLQDKPELAEIYRALAKRAVEIASRVEGADAPDRAGLDAIRSLLAPHAS
jgi:predicted short-subunit dehydrogenase-like oxidoreductase (DUF2520 family)